MKSYHTLYFVGTTKLRELKSGSWAIAQELSNLQNIPTVNVVNQLQTIQTAIVNLQTTVTALQTSVTNFQAGVTTLQTGLTTLQATLQQNLTILYVFFKLCYITSIKQPSK